MVGDDPYSTLPPSAEDPLSTRQPVSSTGRQPTEARADRPRAMWCVGNYLIERELGRGGMGEVYLATHARFRDRRYAVKLISAHVDSAEAEERFRREVEAIGTSRHPNLLYAIDAGSHDGRPYLVTEFVEGHDLAWIIRERGALPVSSACEIGRQAALGLAFAHANGIVHRDVKPQNVMVQPSGQVKVLDLGLATVRDATGAERRADGVVGTPAYMPPEQWRADGPVTASADIYALGCTLFEMLAGRPPFPLSDHADVASLRHAHLALPPPRLAEVAAHVPGDVARLVERCLAKDPDQRPRRCDDVVTALELHAAPFVAAELGGDTGNEPATAARPGAAEFAAFIDEPRIPDTGGRRLRVLAALATSLCVSLVGLGLAYLGPGATAAWRLRFDRLGDPRFPAGTGLAIEATRSIMFLGLVYTVAYFRFRLPLQRFLSPRLNTPRVWLARGIFGVAMFLFLQSEFRRQWFAEHAATDMAAWAADHGLETTPRQEVTPYRWYLGYSFVHYTFIFGGLLLLPILQFVLADLPYVRRAMTLFDAAQRAEANAMDSVDRLYAVARVLRRLAARYVDTAGVLAIGVQFEYWIGRWTLTEKGYLIEVSGMLVTAGFMVLILGYLASQYAAAVEITGMARGGHLDHRIQQRLEQFSLAWFLQSTFFSRPGGIAILSLVVLALVAGRRSLF